ncbi:MAG TPA: hypothetical protein VK766_07975 [Cytophagaceae bacterium]|jgi:hypothetical protein|nr:hypothetical protein [Cytophagaceae bacterium]
MIEINNKTEGRKIQFRQLGLDKWRDGILFGIVDSIYNSDMNGDFKHSAYLIEDDKVLRTFRPCWSFSGNYIPVRPK